MSIISKASRPCQKTIRYNRAPPLAHAYNRAPPLAHASTVFNDHRPAWFEKSHLMTFLENNRRHKSNRKTAAGKFYTCLVSRFLTPGGQG